MAHGTHHRGSAKEPAGAVGLTLRQAVPARGRSSARTRSAGRDSRRRRRPRYTDVELVGVDDVRPPAGHEQTCQDGEDGQQRHQRLEPRARHGPDLDPERPEAILICL